jgi:hypothetical protein
VVKVLCKPLFSLPSFLLLPKLEYRQSNWVFANVANNGTAQAQGNEDFAAAVAR